MKISAALLLKAPILGTVKTRLAATIGAPEALRIYKLLVEWQLSQIPKNWTIDIHFAPSDSLSLMENWLSPLTPQKINFFPQPEGNLGIRLKTALQNSLARGADRVALMGGDCPDLTSDYLQNAESHCRSQDATIAPTLDGGYALLILNQFYPQLFENIPWSTSTVFADTKNALKLAQLTSYDLAPVEDIDDLESFKRSRFYSHFII
jgi:uncharacterized protein